VQFPPSCHSRTPDDLAHDHAAKDFHSTLHVTSLLQGKEANVNNQPTNKLHAAEFFFRGQYSFSRSRNGSQSSNTMFTRVGNNMLLKQTNTTPPLT